MSSCIPLRKSLEVDKFKVGKKAISFAMLDSSIEIPFSMVITNDMFEEFVKYNQLGAELEWFRNAKTKRDKIDSFGRLTTAIKNSQFPQKLMEPLQECYDLISLDTNNLQDLSTKRNISKGLICLTRSTSYDDKNNNLPQTVITKETFKQFIETIKKIYISCFTPSAKITEEAKIAIIVSRLPKLKSTIDVNYDLSNDHIYVSSYFGFPDYFNNVEKDEFKVGLEFLKIENKGISNQMRVIVFDAKENKLDLKEFSENNSSQSLPDQMILESCRLVKKIAKVTGSTSVNAQFFATDDSIACVNINTTYSQKSMDEISEKSQNNSEDVSQRHPKQNFDEVINTESGINFLKEIEVFLQNNKTAEMNSSIPIVLRSLESPTKDSVKQALELCKEIISNLN